MERGLCKTKFMLFGFMLGRYCPAIVEGFKAAAVARLGCCTRAAKVLSLRARYNTKTVSPAGAGETVTSVVRDY